MSSADDLSVRLAQRGRARRVRWLIAAGVVLVLAAAAGLAWFSPLLRVDTVTVDGGGITDAAAVRADAEAAVLGVPLPQVRTERLGDELRAQHSTAREIGVSYSGPRSIDVVIEDREPVIAVASGDDAARYDAAGVLIDTVPATEAADAGLPELTVSDGADPSAAAARASALMAVIADALPGEVTDLIASGTTGTLTVRLVLDESAADGQAHEAEVVFGGPEEAERKAEIAGLLLADGAERVDVSVPDVPAAG